MAAQNRVEAVERALTILEAFGQDRETLSLAEVASETGFYKSTILRLCGSLEQFGYIRRLEDGRFQLGPTLWRLGSRYRHGFDLGEHIRPELKCLVEATGETASFFVREGDDRICLYRQNSPQSVRHHIEEGDRLPLSVGAGRVFLACSGGKGDVYNEIRTEGFYTSRGERNQDLAAVAVPVFDGSGVLRGVLSVSTLVSRLDDKAETAAINALKASAKRLAGLIPQ